MGNEITSDAVKLSVTNGVEFIAEDSPLTRLHYFDGKFLRADALALEQEYHRTRVRMANLAAGWGVVHGLGISISGDRLEVGAGMAITPNGNFALATSDVAAAISDLIRVAEPASVEGNAEFGICAGKKSAAYKESSAQTVFEITVGPVSELCGNESVYGKLCESACVTDSRQPYWREGMVLRLRPIGLKLPHSSAVTLAAVHLRNRVASAYFGAAPWLTNSSLDASGLSSDLWCRPASLYERDEVPIGLLVREGGVNRVLDAWSARRERMDAQARGYWQGRMEMRPWNEFLAQILQFQCQLAGLFDPEDGQVKAADDCDSLRDVLDKTRRELEALHRKYSEGSREILKKFSSKPSLKDAKSVSSEMKSVYAELYDLSDQLSRLDIGRGALPQKRMLLNAGFVELPPAGYLPVAIGKQSLEAQLGRMFGEGVALHYHAVRRDEIAQLLEEAQHMERISLTRGLDNAKDIEQVEIFVPDGVPFGAEADAPGIWWQLEMSPDMLESFDLGLQASRDKVITNMQVGRDQLDKQMLAMRMAKVNMDDSGATAAEAPVSGNVALGNLPDRGESQDVPEELRVLLNRLLRTMKSRNVRGLARTEARADGSYGFTLVATLDVEDLMAQVQRLLAKYPALRSNESMLAKLKIFSQLSVYLSGDIAADPLDMALGDKTVLTGEVNFVDEVAEVSGSLTALYDRTSESGESERVVELSFTAVNADNKTFRRVGRISLLRKGDARNGEFVLDDARHDPESSPNFFEWEDSPRSAAMYVLADQARVAVARKYMSSMNEYAKMSSGNSVEATAEADVADVEAMPSGERRQLLKMNALGGMPALTSPIGAAAMNALLGIADASDDAAFVARARRRLFPKLDAPVREGVNAVLDWVMFRRARSHLCCPKPPAAPARSVLEAFRVWHIAVADTAELKELQDALARNDAKLLAGYKFQPVGLLRYRDENTVAEEPESQVQAMWRRANPGQQVVLGRYWEQAPSTGQGWQNHFRLSSMLAQISGITLPPLRGDGAIARLDAVSPPLLDGSVDGGMLVVTTGKALVTLHRVVFMGIGMWADLEPAFKADVQGGWKAFQEALSNPDQSRVDITLRIEDNKLSTANIDALNEAKRKILSLLGISPDTTILAARLEGTVMSDGELPEVQYQEIGKVVNAVFSGPLYKISGVSNLGGGNGDVHVLTIVSVDWQIN